MSFCGCPLISDKRGGAEAMKVAARCPNIARASGKNGEKNGETLKRKLFNNRDLQLHIHGKRLTANGKTELGKRSDKFLALGN